MYKINIYLEYNTYIHVCIIIFQLLSVTLFLESGILITRLFIPFQYSNLQKGIDAALLKRNRCRSLWFTYLHFHGFHARTYE